MEHFSKKYNKWLLLGENHKHCKYLYKFGSNFYYHKNKDMMIHIDIVDDYIKNTMSIRWQKSKK
jgi:hypothetical protein